MLVVAAAEEQVEGCSGSANRCGNLSIFYPFGLSDRQTGRSCGLLDFEVDCLNDTTPILRGPGFAILDISYEDLSLRVVDLYELNELRDSNSCHVPRWNTSIKLRSEFKISPTNLNLVFYNCPGTSAGAARRDGTMVRCVNQSDTFVSTRGFYNETSDNTGFEGCEATVMPVLGSSDEAKASDYEKLIGDGFLLTWDPPPGSGKLTHPTVLFLFHVTQLWIEKSCSPVHSISLVSNDEPKIQLGSAPGFAPGCIQT
jgi:hypothetical protein